MVLNQFFYLILHFILCLFTCKFDLSCFLKMKHFKYTFFCFGGLSVNQVQKLGEEFQTPIHILPIFIFIPQGIMAV